MTDTFRLQLSQARQVPTDWPGITCFAVQNGFCALCQLLDSQATPTIVYGVNRDGDLETKYRYSIAGLRCARHIDGEVQPQ